MLLERLKSGDIEPTTSLIPAKPHYTPWFAALSLGRDISPEQLEELIAIVETPDFYAIRHSLSRQSVETISVLKAYGLDTQNIGDVYGRNLLTSAILDDNTDLSRYLFEQGDQLQTQWTSSRTDKNYEVVITQSNLLDRLIEGRAGRSLEMLRLQGKQWPDTIQLLLNQGIYTETEVTQAYQRRTEKLIENIKSNALAD